MRTRRLWARLCRDQRGEADTVSWIVVQVPLWFLLALVFVVAMVGIKKNGTASQAQLAVRTAGAATLAAGQAHAQTHGDTWGAPGDAAHVTGAPAQRAVYIRWAYTWQSGVDLITRLTGPFRVEVQQLERREGFYAGPPGAWE